eukprot:CAMPEP_0197661196 /NCGR_PEP_ID=MMETSP1338-20131121/51308_1 /TAXON_ID=43686 ORGANISM="Pelagodinium beii, Strain RCC1491" /NCGR_SAMPLE_ID=MMETSP1338 /ASSEMBLY_ACC=CAM_ASM_000754 /LENGTH=407 /DNA_ID=CAMNT_0043238709 /DNA_START=116 /DNA_END=1339 /DNA_ORIENTATION=+
MEASRLSWKQGPFPSKQPGAFQSRPPFGDVTCSARVNNGGVERLQCAKCGEDILGVVCRTEGYDLQSQPMHFGCAGSKMSSVRGAAISWKASEARDSFSGEAPSLAQGLAQAEAPSVEDWLEILSIRHPPLVDKIHAFVADEVREFYRSQLSRESGYQVTRDYMTSEGPEMLDAIRERAHGVDYLRKVCAQYGLDPDIFHVAVNLSDRYFCQTGASPGWMIHCMPLVNIAALRLAVKFDKPDSILLRAFSTALLPWADRGDVPHIRAFSREELNRMETEICESIDFQLLCPTSCASLKLQLTSGLATITPFHHEVAPLLVSQFLQHPDCMKSSASQAAGAALLLCNELLGRKAWPVYMATTLLLTEASLRPLAEKMRTLLAATVIRRESFTAMKLSSSAKRLLKAAF